MIPSEMFPKVRRDGTETDIWLHVPAIDLIEHIDEDLYRVYINGVQHDICVDDPQKTFPFLKDE